MNDRYEISRHWWFPFFVSVWERTPVLDGEHWKKGHYEIWSRRGVFFRRSTAERFVEWHKAQYP